MNTYTATAPNGKVINFDSKRDVTHVVFADIDYSNSQDWGHLSNDGVQVYTKTSSLALAQKAAAKCLSNCKRNGLSVQTWIVKAGA